MNTSGCKSFRLIRALKFAKPLLGYELSLYAIRGIIVSLSSVMDFDMVSGVGKVL